MLTVKINDPWIEEHLAVVAKAHGKSPEEFVMDNIAEYLEDLEDYEECERRMADIQSGKRRTYTHEEVVRELGLAH